MRSRLALLLAFVAAPFWLGHGVPAQAAEPWPARPVRLVVPGSPGGAADTLARALAERLTVALKQPVIVDNKPGANGLIATKTLMAAPADGYTMLYGTASSTVMLTALKPDIGIDFTKDLEPVAVTVFGGVLLAVNPQLPVKDLKELIDFVKAHPEEYGYASWGVGSNGHLTMEWLKARTGMRTYHVVYKGMAPILTELAAGVVKIGWVDVVGSLPFIQSGKLRAIAVNGSARTPQLPDVPTMGEEGYPFPGTGWQGIFAPKGTHSAIIERVHAEINEIQATPEMRDLTVRLNVEAPPIWTTEQFRELLVRDLQTWKKIVAETGVTVE